MILMSPSISLGKTEQERKAFLRKVGVMQVKTVTRPTLPDLSEKEVEDAAKYLRANGIGVGEVGFHKGFASPDKNEHRTAMEYYRRVLVHAHILKAHCVAFPFTGDRGPMLRDPYKGRLAAPALRSEDSWNRSIRATKELALEAEKLGVTIAAHPHLLSVLYSIERCKNLLESVASPSLKILLDPVNLVQPETYFRITEFLHQIFEELGKSIIALHAKDSIMSGGGKIVAHLNEAVPGEGVMDYAALLKGLNNLPHDITLYVEHFPEEKTIAGQQYIRYIARKNNIEIG